MVHGARGPRTYPTRSPVAAVNVLTPTAATRAVSSRPIHRLPSEADRIIDVIFTPTPVLWNTPVIRHERFGAQTQGGQAKQVARCFRQRAETIDEFDLQFAQCLVGAGAGDAFVMHQAQMHIRQVVVRQ